MNKLASDNDWKQKYKPTGVKNTNACKSKKNVVHGDG
jgi:hypothetical protein